MVRLSGTFSREGASGSSSSKTAQSATFAPTAIGDSPQRAFKSLPLWFKDSTGGPASDTASAKAKPPQPSSANFMAAGPSSSSSSLGLTGWVRTRKNSKGAPTVLDQAGKQLQVEPAGPGSRGASQDLLRASAKSPETVSSGSALGRLRKGEGSQGQSGSSGGSGSGLSRFFSSRRKANQAEASVVSPTRKQPPQSLEGKPAVIAKPSPPVAIISSAFSKGQFSPQLQDTSDAVESNEKPLPSPRPSASSVRARRPPPLGAADVDGTAFEFPPRSATQPGTWEEKEKQEDAPAVPASEAQAQVDGGDAQYAVRAPRPAHAEHTSSRSAPLLMSSSYASSSDNLLSFVYNPTRVHSPDEAHTSTAQAAASASASAEPTQRPTDRKRTNSLADRLTTFLAGGSASAPKQQDGPGSSSRQSSGRRPQTADNTTKPSEEPMPSSGATLSARRAESSGDALRRRPSQLLLLGSSRKEETLNGTASSAPATTTKRKLSLRRLKPSIFSSAISPPSTPEIHSWKTPPLDKLANATAAKDDDVQVVSSASAARGQAISRVPVPRLETPDYTDSFGDPRGMLREAGIASRASTTAPQGPPTRSTTPAAEHLLESMPRSDGDNSVSAANESSEIQGLGLITGEEAKDITAATTTLLHRSGSLSAGRRGKGSREGKEVVGDITLTTATNPKSRAGTHETQITAVAGGSTGPGDSSSDTKMAGPRSPSRPYSLISADGTDTPILRLRKLVVDTDEPAEVAASSEDFFFRAPGSGSNVSSIRSAGGSGGHGSSEGGSSPDARSKNRVALAAQAAGVAAKASAAVTTSALSQDAAQAKQQFATPLVGEVDSPSLPSESSSRDTPSGRARKPMPRLGSSDPASSIHRHSGSQDSKRASQDDASRRASQASWAAPGASSSRFSMISGHRIRASLQLSEAGTAVTAGSDGMSALEAEVGHARRLDVAPAVMQRVKVEEWTRSFGRKSFGGSTRQQQPALEPLNVEVPAHPRRASASSREPSSGSRSGSVGLPGGTTFDALPEHPAEGPVAPPNDFHDPWHPFNPKLSDAVLASSPPRSRSHPQNLTMASTPVNPPSPNTAAADEAARLGKTPAKRVRRSQSQPLRQRRSDKPSSQTSSGAVKPSAKTGTARSSRSKQRAKSSIALNPDSSPEVTPHALRNVLRPSPSGNLRERKEEERVPTEAAWVTAGLVASASAPPRKVRSASKLRRAGTEQSSASSVIAPATPADTASPPTIRRKGSEKAMSALSPQTLSSPQEGSSTPGSGSQLHAHRPKPTYATSEEAALAKRREAAERERRHREKQERKDAERQAAYARRKKSDPLLAARLALVGLTGIPSFQGPVPDIPGFVEAGRKREGRADEESPAASEVHPAASSRLLSVGDAPRSAAHSGRPSSHVESTFSFATALEEEQSMRDRPARSRQQSGSSVIASPSAPAHEPTAVASATTPIPRTGGHSHSGSFDSIRRRVMTPEVVRRASHSVDRPATASSLVTVDSATTLAALDFPVPPHRSRVAQTSDDGTVLARGKLEEWESPRPVSVVSRSSVVEPRSVETVREEDEHDTQGNSTIRAALLQRIGEDARSTIRAALLQRIGEDARSSTPTTSVVAASSTFVEPPSSTTSSKLTVHGVTRPISTGNLRESPTKARVPELVGGPSPVISDSASVTLTPDLERRARG